MLKLNLSFLFLGCIPSNPVERGGVGNGDEVLITGGTPGRNVEIRCQEDSRRWESYLHRSLDRADVGRVFWIIIRQPYLDL